MNGIVLPKDVDVVIASYGGVGTTFLINYFSQYMKTNKPYDRDGLKHSPLPPVSFSDNVKFVYIYGNPQLAAISLFRREYHHAQSRKLNIWGKTSSPIPKDMTLQEYTSQGVDKFHFKNHFYNWYDKYLSVHPTMFIRYEAIFDNAGLILDFLGLPKDCINDFPKKKKRSSSLKGISTETLKQLNYMYGDFSDELTKLDDVEIRKNARHKYFAMTTYLKFPYLRAFLRRI